MIRDYSRILPRELLHSAPLGIDEDERANSVTLEIETN